MIKGDKLVVDKYLEGATKYSAYNGHSVTKSIMSALLGLAIQQRKLSSEDALVMLFTRKQKRNFNTVSRHCCEGVKTEKPRFLKKTGLF
ncbi:hypothetical protein CLV24_107143 [Pontibacter ummariensis]|uniref:Beta-lactamase n=1 Tax=Pontibacter ummariensis TaxID=1610492 RepID=A0A239ETD2_9BACT|nr:hypothetical protein [Pontibacter ummariensis]PRY12771.1 hypothetical protein CLV24_107143 [Pontibacter ummariensis]SNS47538.1 hypothetical protein SAMN06296052_10745 [Pontibacter ummariensis]